MQRRIIRMIVFALLIIAVWNFGSFVINVVIRQAAPMFSPLRDLLVPTLIGIAMELFATSRGD